MRIIHAASISVTIQSSRVVANEGGSINISVTAKGPGKDNFEYRWRRRDGIPLSNTASGTNSQNLTVAPVTLSDSGVYYCVVVNQWHRNASDYTTVTILSK